MDGLQERIEDLDQELELVHIVLETLEVEQKSRSSVEDKQPETGKARRVLEKDTLGQDSRTEVWVHQRPGTASEIVHPLLGSCFWDSMPSSRLGFHKSQDRLLLLRQSTR
jgi:hypothetical protein